MTDKTLEAQPDETPSDVREETETYEWEVLRLRVAREGEAAQTVYENIGSYPTPDNWYISAKDAAAAIGSAHGAGAYLLLYEDRVKRISIVAETVYRVEEPS